MVSGITIERSKLTDEWIAIAVTGEIDLATVGDLDTAMDQVLADGDQSLVVDLNGSSFMDSTGLKALIMADRRFGGAGRGFAVAVGSGPISRLIDLSGVRGSLRVVDSPDDVM
jgi:anti-sigma B factor antagonist